MATRVVCSVLLYGTVFGLATTALPVTTTLPVTTSTPGPCDVSPCINGGSCYSIGYMFTCLCPSGYSGPFCNIEPQPQPTTTTTATTTPQTTASGHCATRPCLNGGLCSEVGGGFVCLCPPGFQHPICQKATTTTTLAPTTAASNCLLLNKHQLGCSKADVIFLVEHFSSDPNECSIYHQKHFIKNIVKRWSMNNIEIRTGVVSYYSSTIVKQDIGLNEYHNDVDGFIHTLSPQHGHCRPNMATSAYEPSGHANLAAALDYIKSISFKDARPGVPRVVIPFILSQMDGQWHHNLGAASQRLKDTCTSIMPVVQLREDCHEGTCLNWAHSIASQPYKDFYQEYNIPNPEGHQLPWWHEHQDCFGSDCGQGHLSGFCD